MEEISRYSLALYFLAIWVISALEAGQECAPFFPGVEEASMTNIPHIVNAYEVPDISNYYAEAM